MAKRFFWIGQPIGGLCKVAFHPPRQPSSTKSGLAELTPALVHSRWEPACPRSPCWLPLSRSQMGEHIFATPHSAHTTSFFLPADRALRLTKRNGGLRGLIIGYFHIHLPPTRQGVCAELCSFSPSLVHNGCAPSLDKATGPWNKSELKRHGCLVQCEPTLSSDIHSKFCSFSLRGL